MTTPISAVSDGAEGTLDVCTVRFLLDVCDDATELWAATTSEAERIALAERLVRLVEVARTVADALDELEPEDRALVDRMLARKRSRDDARQNVTLNVGAGKPRIVAINGRRVPQPLRAVDGGR